MSTFIAALVLTTVNGTVLVMPFADVGPRSAEECSSIGQAALEYARGLDAQGGLYVTLQDGSQVDVDASAYTCIPLEWYDPSAV